MSVPSYLNITLSSPAKRYIRWRLCDRKGWIFRFEGVYIILIIYSYFFWFSGFGEYFTCIESWTLCTALYVIFIKITILRILRLFLRNWIRISYYRCLNFSILASLRTADYPQSWVNRKYCYRWLNTNNCWKIWILSRIYWERNINTSFVC